MKCVHKPRTETNRFSSAGVWVIQTAAWEEGAQITFTKMDGIVVTYALSSPQTTASANIDPVQNSRHDLVLYTCTSGGAYRVTVSAQ